MIQTTLDENKKEKLHC